MKKMKWAEDFKKTWGFYPMGGGDVVLPHAPGAPAPGEPAPGAPAPGAPAPGAPAPGAPAPVDFTTLIPADFKDKPWVKETKDLTSLFKRTDDLITEIGKRPAGIPQDNATPDQIAAFNKAWGVPDKPEGYQFQPLPKELGEANPEFQNSVRAMFHKNGVSAKQAAGLEKEWNDIALAMVKKSTDAADALDKDFEKLKTEVFGNRAAEAVKGAGVLISKFVPEKMKAHVANLPNEQLIILASVIDGIRKEYIPEDRMPQGGGPAVGLSVEEKRAKAQKLMALPAYQNQFHKDHAATKKEVDEIYASLPK